MNFPVQSEFNYLKGSSASGLSSDWMSESFDDSGWATGNAPFWYGDGSGGVELTDMINTYSTMYLRSSFYATDVENINEIILTVNYDDGFIVWINGDEVLSILSPATPSYDAFAADNHESGTFETFVLNTSDFTLHEGANIIAVQGFNVSLESSDFHFDIGITASTDTPEVEDPVGLSFNYESGFYDTPFNLTISTADSEAQIIYTLDGSNPQYSTTGFTGGTSVSVPIDPSSTTGRPATPGVVVRASISKPGFIPSKPVSRTYLFIENLKTQSYPGPDWPDYNVNGQWIDLEMDADIVNDSRYSNLIDDALLDIPTLSIVTDIGNLFDPVTGIYVNAEGHGYEWERECTVELFNDENSDGFLVNAGLRIRGGWSRHDEYPKHAFRLFFREEYGYPKLDFPLFGDEGTDKYDKVDLRCAQNYAWSNSDGRNTMVHEVFSRDTQGDMDQPYTRSRYYHLYLNGMYWGIFQTQERSEARYASDYLGGDREDWDVVKVSTENYEYRIEATDGYTDAWREVWNRCSHGFESNSDYFDLQGKHPDGSPKSGSEVLVDIDNLIDYMLVIFYTGNFDAPTSSFGSNKGPNNFYALFNRNDKSKGFVFLNHDAEHSLMYYSTGTGVGIDENRVDIGDREDGFRMEVSDFSGFHPQWLHHKLIQNEEYRERFKDRAYMYLSGNGVLTPEKCRDRLNERVEQIEMAIIAESARWGDVGPQPGYNKDDNWLPQIDIITNQFFSQRTNIVIGQLEDENLYTTIEPPSISSSGGEIEDYRVALESEMVIEFDNPNSSGSIYYTLNGEDPRYTGGNIRTSATETNDGGTLTINTSTILNARVYNNGNWSALKQVLFLGENDDYSNLKITELHYNPPEIIEGTDTIAGKGYEFIEFKNTGETALNLSGLVLDSAIRYTFPSNIILPPKRFYVVAANSAKFYETYSLVPSGTYKGNLSNSSEEILLKTSGGEEIMHFTYSGNPPWDPRANGTGKSLVPTVINPTGDPGNPGYWTTSMEDGGSPFRNEGDLDDIESPEYTLDYVVNVYPNPVTENVYIDLSSHEDNQSFQIELYDISGIMLYKSSGQSEMMINLKELNVASGIYFLNVISGNKVSTSKIIFKP